MKLKYTKNDHARYLSDGGIAIDKEAQAMLRQAKASGRIGSVGFWLQSKDREIFNRDYDSRTSLST